MYHTGIKAISHVIGPREDSINELLRFIEKHKNAEVIVFAPKDSVMRDYVISQLAKHRITAVLSQDSFGDHVLKISEN